MKNYILGLLSAVLFFGAVIATRVGLNKFTMFTRESLETRVHNYKLKSKLIVTRNLFQKFAHHDMNIVLEATSSKERDQRLKYFTSLLLVEYERILGVPLNDEVKTYAQNLLDTKGKNISERSKAHDERMKKALLLAQQERQQLSSLAENSDLQKIYSVMANFQVENPNQYLDEGQSIYSDKEKIQVILGTLEGQLLHISGEATGRVDDVVIQTDFHMQDGEFNGELNVTLSHQGEVYSQMKEQGPSIIKEHLDRLNDVIIEAGPEMFFQLIHVKEGDFFIGNYYENGVHRAVAKLFPQ